MATYQPTPMPYTPYRATTGQYDPGRASTTSDPRKIAANQLQQVQGQGTALQQNELDLANQYAQQASGVEQYLNPIESNLAQGGGGYNTTESAAINLSPQDKQNLVTGAGISAGANTAAGVGAAERAAAAAGGNPAALATYRARAAQQEGAQAGDAMTQARSRAKELESAGAQTTGGARLAQQNQGLGYYGGLQQEKAGQATAEQGLQNQTYGTQTGGTGQASGLGVQASQTPSTFDKILGGVAGVAGGLMSKLADGTSSEDSAGIDAVLGEDGPEVIVEHASDPDRSHTEFMEDGDAGLPIASGPYGATATAGQMNPVQGPTIFTRFMNALGKPGAPTAAPAQAAPAEQWNKTTPYSQAGTAIGQGVGALIASKMADGTPGYRARLGQPMADGNPWWAGLANKAGDAVLDGLVPRAAYMADGFRARSMPAPDEGLPAPAAPKFNPGKLITNPTRVHLAPGDEVVPLTYRPKAKVRPSAALSTLSPVRLAPRLKHTFGGPRA